ncbi:MAG: Crp/Fnr family transcriptional regulator [Bacteroidales bacterium]|nr:Crp/Fnr family transcriptional regulator [Bacteroidales bacterium]
MANKLYLVKKGCLRQWFNKDGKDITFQFFFENQTVASFDSFINNIPSIFSIESIEPGIVYSLSKKDFDNILMEHAHFKDKLLELAFQRFRHYTQLFLSMIKDSPRERYEELQKNHPEILQRVPQHYIASYLGITSVSLSRIRNRK